MCSAPRDVAQIRLDNAMRLFEEFVAATIKHPDAAALRGLERRFAERLQIQPSYWSQIKSRSRQIGERLARQFEQLSHKPMGWMDQEQGLAAAGATSSATSSASGTGTSAAPEPPPGLPQDDDERFIVGLVLTYYRRHPQRARTRLLDLLGEVLTPGSAAPLPAPVMASVASSAAGSRATGAAAKVAKAAAPDGDEWLKLQRSVAPLKPKKR